MILGIMKKISSIRASLFSGALLLTTALTAPAFSAALPELSPRQIASDVKMSYNPQTGQRDFVAPTFDPFEDDRELAGTAQLRSVGQAVSINGQTVHGGAMLDLSFYYNSGSADPYDNRGYEEAVYLSGEYAPVTRREANVLECSEEIREVVYYHEDYYAPSFHLNLFRPYRHYSGFNSFGRRVYGGYSPYAYSGGYYGGERLGRRIFGGQRNRVRNRDGRRSDRQRDNEERSRADNQDSNDRARNEETRSLIPERQRGLAIGRRTDAYRARRRGQNARNIGMSPRVGSRMNRRLENAEPLRPQRATSQPRIRTEAAPQVPAPKAPAPTRAAPPRAILRQSTERQSTPRRSSPRADRPNRDRIRNEVRSSRGIKSRNSPRLGGKRIMALSPMASFFGRGGRQIASQCAREEKLSLHIPQARLDAARFDGLTVLVLDRSGQELPVFIPPNYIEGFRQASAASQVTRPSYVPSSPTYTPPTYSVPGYSAPQTAPCPNGTTPQTDGTCLTNGSSGSSLGYPTR